MVINADWSSVITSDALSYDKPCTNHCIASCLFDAELICNYTEGITHVYEAPLIYIYIYIGWIQDSEDSPKVRALSLLSFKQYAQVIAIYIKIKEMRDKFHSRNSMYGKWKNSTYKYYTKDICPRSWNNMQLTLARANSLTQHAQIERCNS